MDVVLLCLAILAVAAYVAVPLYRGDTAPARQPRTASAGAEASRTALADLEVDLASGLIDDATYDHERAVLEARSRSEDGGND